MHYIPNTYSGGAVIVATGKSATLYIQNLDSSKCTTTPITVIDSRDNQEYVVQRLADGKCWMLDNLRLGSTTDSVTLTKNDSNINTETYTLPKSGDVCFTGSSCTGTSGISGTGYTVAAINASLKNNIPATTYGGNGSNKYGVFYNYCAASAGTICSSLNTSNATYDVCPAGWRMPTGGSSGEYQSLCNAVKGSTCSNGDQSAAALRLRAVFSMPLSSLWETAGHRSETGFYAWTSTYRSAYSANYHMYALYLEDGKLYPQTNSTSWRWFGFSMRCILK